MFHSVDDFVRAEMSAVALVVLLMEAMEAEPDLVELTGVGRFDDANEPIMSHFPITGQRGCVHRL